MGATVTTVASSEVDFAAVQPERSLGLSDVRLQPRSGSPGISAEWQVDTKSKQLAFLQEVLRASVEATDPGTPSPTEYSVRYFLPPYSSSHSAAPQPLTRRRFATTSQTVGISFSESQIRPIYGSYGDLSPVRVGVLAGGDWDFYDDLSMKPLVMDLTVSESELADLASFLFDSLSESIGGGATLVSPLPIGTSGILPQVDTGASSQAGGAFIQIWRPVPNEQVFTTEYENPILRAEDLDDSEPSQRVLISMSQLRLGPSAKRRRRVTPE
jgi:hypothetical protein